MEFIMERLRSQYLDDPAAGVGTEAFDAVLATRPRSPLDTDARVRALVEFLKRPEAESLAAANRRIAISSGNPRPPGSGAIDTGLLRCPRNRTGAARGAETSGARRVERSQREGNYGAALSELARLDLRSMPFSSRCWSMIRTSACAAIAWRCSLSCARCFRASPTCRGSRARAPVRRRSED